MSISSAVLTPLMISLSLALLEQRLRVALQLALAEHKHLLEQAQVTPKRTGQSVPIGPIAGTFIYHLQLLDLTEKSPAVKPQDLVALRQHNKHIVDALIESDPNAPKAS